MSNVKKYYSFLLGILAASIIWLIILCFYVRQGELRPFSSIQVLKQAFRYDVQKDSVLPYEAANFNALASNKKKYFENSDSLKKKLQPIIVGDIDQELGILRTVEDKHRREEGFKLFAFNILISEAIGMHRTLPDTRNKLCKNQKYPIDLPTVSIIICFYNEHFTTLMRSVHSILDRTPDYLINDIILVNDFSDLDDLHGKVVNYVTATFPDKVQVYKTKKRLGLIRARIFGSKKAGGQVLVFLDSHIEVNEKWLEPLLSRIAEDPTRIAVPIIDIINAETFKYSASPLVRGGFNWGLHFKWDNLPREMLKTEEDFIKPFPTPTMAGGLFAMDREYFHKLGDYDPGMNIWGGENLEISFRVWMCGGSLEIIPCSRVGHVFRKRRPYGAADNTMVRNSLRVANVWMDGYKTFFYKQHPEATSVPYGNVSERIKLRKKLKCHTFEWYLKTIYPELILPSDSEEKTRNKLIAVEQPRFQPWHSRKRNYLEQFQIRLVNTSLCVASENDSKSKGSLLVLKTCLRSRSQTWYQTDRNELVLNTLLCMDAGDVYPKLAKCHEMGESQEWVWKGQKNALVYNNAQGMCLASNKPDPYALVTMELCSKTDGLIYWTKAAI